MSYLDTHNTHWKIIIILAPTRVSFILLYIYTANQQNTQSAIKLNDKGKF